MARLRLSQSGFWHRSVSGSFGVAGFDYAMDLAGRNDRKGASLSAVLIGLKKARAHPVLFMCDNRLLLNSNLFRFSCFVSFTGNRSEPQRQQYSWYRQSVSESKEVQNRYLMLLSAWTA